MRPVVLLLTGLALCAPAAVQAQEKLGEVTRYVNATVRVFDDQGLPIGPPRRAAELPRLPADIVAISRGTYGVADPQAAGRVIYMRGIDIQFALTTPRDCPLIAELAAPADRRTTGVSAGAGTGAGCRR